MSWRGKNGKGSTQRVFFATDLHGSERCFRKWLNAREAYRADILILGGDIAGKALVPIVHEGQDRWTAEFRGEQRTATSDEELTALRHSIEMVGYYSLVVEPDEKAELDADPERLEQVFRGVMRDTVARWMELADERLPEGFPAFAMLGNDDYPELAQAIVESEAVEYGEAGVKELDGGVEVLSFGFSNPTPWDSPRELPEDRLRARIASLADQLSDPASAIFNVHCPPRGTSLDQAPMLDGEMRLKSGMAGGVELGPVGSTAVRETIEQVQPMLALHGHVHECSAGEKIGRTLCINPGSDYLMGVLRGALIEIGSGEVRGWQMTEG